MGDFKVRPPGMLSHGIALAVGMPFALAGLLCCITLVLAPIGVILLILSGLPLSLVCMRRTAWNLRDQPLQNEVSPPWL